MFYPFDQTIISSSSVPFQLARDTNGANERAKMWLAQSISRNQMKRLSMSTQFCIARAVRFRDVDEPGIFGFNLSLDDDCNQRHHGKS